LFRQKIASAQTATICTFVQKNVHINLLDKLQAVGYSQFNQPRVQQKVILMRRTQRQMQRLILAAGGAVVAGVASGGRAQSFSITDIPTLDPSDAGVIYPQAISPTGEVTGYYMESSRAFGNVATAFIAQVTGSTVTSQSIGYVGGNALPSAGLDYPGFQSYNFGINAAGVTVGGGNPTTNLQYSLTEYGSAPMQSLGTLPLDGYTTVGPQFPSFAAAISNNNVVVGASLASGTGTDYYRYVHAVAYTPGQGLTDLTSGEGYNMSVAYAINPAGTAAVGFYSPQPGTSDGKATTGKVATMWTLSGSTWTQSTLGTLGGAQSIAYGINAMGQVIGVSETTAGAVDPFLRQPDGTMIDLNVSGSSGSQTLGNPIPGNKNGNAMISSTGILGNVLNNNLALNSCVDAINDLGQIVGYAGGTNYPYATLTTINSSGGVTTQNLNTLIPSSQQSVWHLSEATAINDQEQIVGWGLNQNDGGETGFLLSLAPIGTWSSSSGGSWTASSNWHGGIPNAVGVVATFGATPGLTSNGIVTLDGNQTVGHIVFNNNGSSYTLNTGSNGTLTIDDTNDVAGASPSITVSAGSHTINAPIVLATNNGSMGVTINTWVGTTLTLGGSVTALNGGSATLTTTGGGNLVINPGSSIYVPVIADGPITFAANTSGNAGFTVHTVSSITLGATTIVALAPAPTQATRQLLVTTPIFQQVTVPDADLNGSHIAWAGQIDLANNDMDVPNGNLSTLTAQVAEGYNTGYMGGTWSGTNLFNGYVMGATIIYNGIVSSAAANDTTFLTALGVIQNTTASGSRLYSTFDGQPVAASDVLIKYTYYGDADLNGKVDGSDYSRIDNGYLNKLTGWGNGDFNYDGVIDGSDYTLIDNAYNTQGASLQASVADTTAEIAPTAGSGTSSVPEPAVLGMLGPAAGMILRRRSRPCRS
jgi:probable HAF family extracellular repeat protein